MKREIAYILIFFFALQSCTIYNKTSVSIYEAVKTVKPKSMNIDPLHPDQEGIVSSIKEKRNSKVKVVLYGNKQIFDYLEVREDSLYYGIKEGNSFLLAKQYDDYTVYLKNKDASAAATAIVIAIPVVLLGLSISSMSSITYIP